MVTLPEPGWGFLSIVLWHYIVWCPTASISALPSFRCNTRCRAVFVKTLKHFLEQLRKSAVKVFCSKSSAQHSQVRLLFSSRMPQKMPQSISKSSKSSNICQIWWNRWFWRRISQISALLGQLFQATSLGKTGFREEVRHTLREEHIRCIRSLCLWETYAFFGRWRWGCRLLLQK